MLMRESWMLLACVSSEDTPPTTPPPSTEALEDNKADGTETLCWDTLIEAAPLLSQVAGSSEGRCDQKTKLYK